MAEKVLLTADKGGVGVTTCCVGLGIAMAAKGFKTLIVDGDWKSGGALTLAGCSNMQVFTLADFKAGACRAKQIIISCPNKSNLHLLPTLGCNDGEALVKAVREAEGLYDFVIADKCAEKICTAAIVISEPYVASVKSADGKIAELADAGFKDIGVILNKVNGGLIYDGEIMPPEEIACLLRVKLKAVIPEDLNLPIGKWKPATLAAFKTAMLAICEKKDKIYSVINGYTGVNGYFKRKMRSRL